MKTEYGRHFYNYGIIFMILGIINLFSPLTKKDLPELSASIVWILFFIMSIYFGRKLKKLHENGILDTKNH